MKRYGGNHHEKLGRRRISCAGQFTMPDMAGTSRDPVCSCTDTRSSQPNQARRTPDFAYLLIILHIILILILISLFLVHNPTIIAEYKVKSSLSISPCHDHELTPSIVYTEYSIHRVQHPPSTASSQDWLSFFHSHDYKLTPKCSFSIRHASLHN